MAKSSTDYLNDLVELEVNSSPSLRIRQHDKIEITIGINKGIYRAVIVEDIDESTVRMTLEKVDVDKK